MKSAIKKNFELAKYGIKADKLLFLIKIINLLFSSVFSYATLILPKYLLIAIREKSIVSIMFTLASFFGVSCIYLVYTYLTAPILEKRKEKMNIKILDEFLKHSINLKLAFFEQEASYDKYTLVFNKCCNLVQLSVDSLLDIISSIIQLGLVISIISWLDRWIIILLILGSILYSYINNKIKKINYKFQKKMNTSNRKLNYLYRLFHIPEFIRDIRANNLIHLIFRKKDVLAETILNDTVTNAKNIIKHSSIINLLGYIESFVITLYFAICVIREIIWYDDFIVSLNAYNRLKSVCSQLFELYNRIFENSLYINDYIDFMNNKEYLLISGKLEIHANQIESIIFRNVSFKYPNKDKLVLKNISFTIKKGEKVALIGKNGAGKTTIVKLLLRLYDASDGEILINNLPLCEYNIDSLRRAISVLFQDYTIYAFSIRDNIALGKDMSEEKLNKAIQMADMEPQVASTPRGLETPITSQFLDQGVEFSGGELQRLALCRIFASENDFLILDEPTSNLDPIIESRLFERLLDESGSTTMIIISHRLTFTYKMDRIICIEKGQLAEQGSHSELMQIESGIYKSLYIHNLNKYSQTF